MLFKEDLFSLVLAQAPSFATLVLTFHLFIKNVSRMWGFEPEVSKHIMVFKWSQLWLVLRSTSGDSG